MVNTVSLIVILNKNSVIKKKTMKNSTKRALLSNSTNSLAHGDKKNMFFVLTKKQDNVFVQTLNLSHHRDLTRPHKNQVMLNF